MAEGGEAGFMEGDILHYSYHSVDDHLRQIDYFSDIAAVAYQGPAWLASPFIRPIKAGFQWFKNAILRGGWRDGATGWTIARWSAYATAEKYRKIRRRMRMERALVHCGRAEIKRILVCRTDAIGDVAVTLPIAGFLKSVNPGLQVDFLTRSYAAPVHKPGSMSTELWCGTDPMPWTGRCTMRRSWRFPTQRSRVSCSSRRSHCRRDPTPLAVCPVREHPQQRIEESVGPARSVARHGPRVVHASRTGIEPTRPADSGRCVGVAGLGELRAEPWSAVADEVKGAAEWIVPGRRAHHPACWLQ